MTKEYVMFMWTRLMESGKPVNVESYLRVCLSKCMVEMVKKLLNEYGAMPTIAMVLAHCIPKKADDPETPLYMELAKLCLDKCPQLLNQGGAGDGTSPLFEAAQCGSLPHVKYILDLGANIDQPNGSVWGFLPCWICHEPSLERLRCRCCLYFVGCSVFDGLVIVAQIWETPRCGSLAPSAIPALWKSSSSGMLSE
jgi:hypothetical protein